MLTNRPVILGVVLMLGCAAGGTLLAGCSGAPPETRTEQTKTGQPGSERAQEGALAQVDTKYVCMINNQRFNKEQIPIEVGGRTYYGCCEMCKAKLNDDPKSRVAVDPVSGKEVDKAKAVVGANADGAVFYFENVENLKRYKAGSKS